MGGWAQREADRERGRHKGEHTLKNESLENDSAYQGFFFLNSVSDIFFVVGHSK